jgi:hypothetical protein
MSNTQELEEQLRAAIREELNAPTCAKLPRLCAQIGTDQGFNTAEEWIFTMCATYGIGVQTAMSEYDSSLGE